jgi:branched-chain amino acid aminotransferase
MSATKVWLNGALVAAEDAVVPVNNHGLTVGDGMFETMKVVDGTAFAVRRHLARLQRSAHGLGLEVPYDDGALRDAIESTVDANQPDAGWVRVTVTGGAGPGGSSRGSERATVVIQCGAATRWSDAAAVVTVPWPRNERGALAGLKTTSYAENVVARERAAAAGAEEALFGNTVGNLCEGTGSNIFVVRDGRLSTPPLASGCLAGVTRELLLDPVLGLAVVEGDTAMTLLVDVEEAFLTSSTRDVQPVASIDERALPSCPGPMTMAARDAFAALQTRDLDP